MHELHKRESGKSVTQMRIEAHSPVGSILVDDEWVTITRKRLVGHDAEKRIAISSIVAVQFKGVGKYGSLLGRLSKSPGSTANLATGLIQFVVQGQESKGGLITARYDENSLGFSSAGQPDFERVRDFIQQRINNRR